MQLVLDAAGGGAFWSSPPGYVTLVKSLVAYNGAAAELTGTLYWSPAFDQGWQPLLGISIAPGATFEWNGWFVLNQNDAVLVSLGGGPARALLSGAVLAGAEQFPPGQARTLQPLPTFPLPPPSGV